MPEERAVIFANGDLPDPTAAYAILRPDDYLYAANGGTRHVLAMGLYPAGVIGDLDSLAGDDRRRLEDGGVRLEAHPRDKDFTDLELTLDYVVKAGYRSILIIAALGGRLDQTLGNLALLTRPDLLTLDVRLDDGLEEVFFVQREARIQGQAGDLLSLLPWSRPAEGITTDGLRWSLCDETLYPDRTRGLSNEFLNPTVAVRVKSGLLLCVHRRLPSIDSKLSIVNRKS